MECVEHKGIVKISTCLCFLIIIGLVVASFYDVFVWMYGRYIADDSYYSHGFLIPFICTYLIWLKKDELQRVSQNSSLIGLFLIIFAILIHVFGTAVYVFSVSGFSIWILVMGISLFIYGCEKTKIVIFPLFFLLFMFPLPSTIITMVSFPLKVLVANVGAKIASLIGIPLLLEGFVITIPQGELLVGNPCSGLRSLIAFLAMGALFAYFSNLSPLRKILLFSSSIPIAIASNLIRVPILIFWSYKWGLESATPDTLVHTGSGFVVFVMGVLLLMLAQCMLGGAYEK